MSDFTEQIWIPSLPESPTCYRIAGRGVWISSRLAGLSHFEADPGGQSPPPIDVPPPQGPRIFQGYAHLAGGRWPVTARSTGHHDWISVPGLGELFVDSRGQVVLHDADPARTEEDLVMTALAPGLALSWCRRGLWLLHASAIRRKGGLVLLMGHSGAGKSTLAAGFGDARVADDCVPVTTDDARVAGPFPQPKLSDYGSGPPPSDIRAIVQLDPGPETASEALIRLRPAESLTALVRHTVAAVLLGPHRMLTHLADCRRLAEAVPCYRLSYRQTPDRIPALLEVIDHQWPE